jgi:hypothetical protein
MKILGKYTSRRLDERQPRLFAAAEAETAGLNKIKTARRRCGRKLEPSPHARGYTAPVSAIRHAA